MIKIISKEEFNKLAIYPKLDTKVGSVTNEDGGDIHTFIKTASYVPMIREGITYYGYMLKEFWIKGYIDKDEINDFLTAMDKELDVLQLIGVVDKESKYVTFYKLADD